MICVNETQIADFKNLTAIGKMEKNSSSLPSNPTTTDIKLWGIYPAIIFSNFSKVPSFTVSMRIA